MNLPIVCTYFICNKYLFASTRCMYSQVNSNPCLEFACPLLEELIGGLINNMFKVAVDVICPPPAAETRTKACEEAVRLIEQEPDLFELIFHHPK